MEDWAWRLPFLIAGPLGLIAIYFRMRIEEAPAFQATRDAQAAAHAAEAETVSTDAPGAVGIFKAYWRMIMVAMTIVAAANTVGYALTSYMPTYLTDNLGYDEVHGTLLTIPILVVMSICIPLAGHLSDKIGRRPVLWLGSITAAVGSIPAFLLIGHGAIWSTLLGLALIAVPVAFYVSNIASALPALFPTASRYGAMGIAYNFAVAIFGGTSPFIIAALIAVTGNDMMPAYYLMAWAAIGAIAIYFLRESANRPLPGSMPSVDTIDEAHELVANQDDNPLLDLNEMPFDHTYELPVPAEDLVEVASLEDPATEEPARM
jgi:MHS family proline/betaine transporter-like MFS transporter